MTIALDRPHVWLPGDVLVINGATQHSPARSSRSTTSRRAPTAALGSMPNYAPAADGIPASGSPGCYALPVWLGGRRTAGAPPLPTRPQPCLPT